MTHRLRPANARPFPAPSNRSWRYSSPDFQGKVIACLEASSAVFGGRARLVAAQPPDYSKVSPRSAECSQTRFERTPLSRSVDSEPKVPKVQPEDRPARHRTTAAGPERPRGRPTL